MDVATRNIGNVTVIELAGDLDGSNAPQAQQQILAAISPASRVALDLSKVPYMSSAGLRMLLSTYRQVTGSGGRIVLVGVVEEIRDTMTVTGFVKFFTLSESLDTAVADLEK